MARGPSHNGRRRALSVSEGEDGADPREDALTPEELTAVQTLIQRLEVPADLADLFDHLAEVTEKLAGRTEAQRATVLGGAGMPPVIEPFLNYTPALLRQLSDLFKATEKKPSRLRPANLVRFSTSKPFNVLHQAFTHAGEEDWTSAVTETGAAVVSRHSFSDVQIRLAATQSPAALATRFPEGDAMSADELRDMVRNYGGEKGALKVQAGTVLAGLYDGEGLSFDDPAIQRTLGYKRPGGRVNAANHLKAWKRETYGSLVLGTWAAAFGQVFSHGGEAVGTQIWSCYGIDHVLFDLEGTPEGITLTASGLSRVLKDNPDAFEYLGLVRDLLALPDTTPGEWARAILRTLRQHWNLKVTKKECRHETKDGRDVLVFPPIPRKLLFHYTQPEPAPEAVLASKNAERAVAYFDVAMDLLQGKGGERYGKQAKHVNSWAGEPTRYRDKAGREPWPDTNPDGTRRRARRGVDWRKAWWEQPLDIRPGGADLAELLERLARSQRARTGLKRGK
jgi:hypothetical protein